MRGAPGARSSLVGAGAVSGVQCACAILICAVCVYGTPQSAVGGGVHMWQQWWCGSSGMVVVWQ